MQETIQTIKHDRNWGELLTPGDVVIFRFPLQCAEVGQITKPRPCLVVGVDVCDGERRVRLAYGSSVVACRHGRNAIVRDPGDLAAAGLRKPTRFDPARQLSVAPDDPRFMISAQHGTAVTGHLDLECLRRPRRRRGYLGRG